MSTAAAPVFWRSARFSPAVRTGASAAAIVPRTERSPPATSRRSSASVNASSAATLSPCEMTAVPSTASPGRNCGSSPPQMPKLTTARRGRSARATNRARSVDASPNAAIVSGPAASAASRLSPLTMRTGERVAGISPPFPGFAGEGGPKGRMGCGKQDSGGDKKAAAVVPSSSVEEAAHTPSGASRHLPQLSLGKG